MKGKSIMTELKVLLIILIIAIIAAAILNVVLIKMVRENSIDSELQTASVRRAEELKEYCSELHNANKKLSEELEEANAENERLEQIILDYVTDEPEVRNKDEPEQSDNSSKERLPEGIPTNIFRCEDYRRLNVESSDQYKLQQECITDAKTGIRGWADTYDVYFCVALAGAYGMTIGDAWQVTLKCGYQFNIILSDFKHSIDHLGTDDFGDYDRNYDGDYCINAIEFVCDLKITPKAVIQAGTMSALEQFGGLYGDGGNIVSMRYLGRKWKP